MVFVLPLFVVNLVCAILECELGANAPHLYVNKDRIRSVINPFQNRRIIKVDAESDIDSFKGGPLVKTKSGFVLGYKMKISDGREIFAFTGVPYGEPPVGEMRFRAPIMKKPWRHIWKATTASPYCIQATVTSGWAIRGQESCLFLDIYTPRLPSGATNVSLPVYIWIPAGGNMYGKSRSYGPNYLLREDIILVVVNVRFGVFGYLSTGDEHSPGNWGLKDQALAIKWVHEHISAFGGDPKKIVVGGVSSGAGAAHLMLFTKNEARDHVAGLYCLSGTGFGNLGLDGVGRVQNASNIIAKAAGCPTAAEGKSRQMVECLRRTNPYLLATYSFIPYTIPPMMSQMLGPTIELDVPDAFISELPETQYEKGTVPPIPVIISRSEDETSFMLQGMRFNYLPIVRLNWRTWMPKFLRNLAFRSFKGEPAKSNEESQSSLLTLNRFYFNKNTPPNFILSSKDFAEFVNMMSDGIYNAPMWKAIEMHHKVAPTFVYINKHKTLNTQPAINFMQKKLSLVKFGASHSTDGVLLFNNSRNIPPIKPGSDSDIASRNLVNLLANFGKFGEPLYRTPDGELHSVWKPITDMKNPQVLEVGLVREIKMILDPLPLTQRMKIWETVKFTN